MRPGRPTVPRTHAVVVLLGLTLFLAPLGAAPACAADETSPPPDPFPTILQPSARPHESYARAHVALVAGAALSAVSFVLSSAAERDYRRYQSDNDPVAIQRDYDAARKNDRWSAGTLLAGTGALALGVYWRFVHDPSRPRVSRIGLTPTVAPDHAALALTVAFR